MLFFGLKTQGGSKLYSLVLRFGRFERINQLFCFTESVIINKVYINLSSIVLSLKIASRI